MTTMEEDMLNIKGIDLDILKDIPNQVISAQNYISADQVNRNTKKTQPNIETVVQQKLQQNVSQNVSQKVINIEKIALLGLNIPKSTLFLIIILILIAFVIWYFNDSKKHKKKNENEDDD